MSASDNFISIDNKELEILDEQTKVMLETIPEDIYIKQKGYGHRRKIEKVPVYHQQKNEKVLQGPGSNSWIVFGKDKPASAASGYGSIGATQASAIDICVGRVGDWKTITQTKTVKGVEKKTTKRELVAENDFVRDAARIYISERTDIDDYFGIQAGKAGGLNGLSGIVVKADNVRLVAREGIKLVTRTDEKNSKGGNMDVVMGVDIIAGNDASGLQPMVKGENLRDLLRYMVEDIRNITSMLHSISLAQASLETMLTAHSHPSTGGVAFPSIELGVYCSVSQIRRLVYDVPAQIKKTFENVLEEIEYLKPYGTKYINSMSNHVN